MGESRCAVVAACSLQGTGCPREPHSLLELEGEAAAGSCAQEEGPARDKDGTPETWPESCSAPGPSPQVWRRSPQTAVAEQVEQMQAADPCVLSRQDGQTWALGERRGTSQTDCKAHMESKDLEAQKQF